MRDTWIFGHTPVRGSASRRYIVRTVVPRFFARVIEDGREDEPPVDLSGAFQKGDTILCEVDWLDSTITPAHWLSEAIDAFNRVAEILQER